MTSEIAITYRHTPQGAPAMAATSEEAINGAGPPAMIEPNSRAKANPE